MERGRERGRERRREQGREQGREGEGGGEAEKPEKEGERLVGGDEGKRGCCQAAARRSRADEVHKGCSLAVEQGRTRPRRS